MILLFIAVIWLAVLGPGMWRRRAEKHSVDSIGKFHRQLGVLQRTGPSGRRGAPRLQALRAGEPMPSGLPLVSSRSGLLMARSHPDDMLLDGEGQVRRPDPYFRPDACRRRRDVLTALVASTLGSALVGMAVSALLLLALLLGLVSVGYVVLLVHSRRLALEREAKLRFLPHRAPEHSVPPARVAAR